MIIIGKRSYKGKRYIDSPTPPGFTKIVVMIRENIAQNEYGSLGPYVLKDEHGYLLENRWQFSKVYKKVPKITQTYSTNNPMIVWQHPEEVHVDNNGNLTPEYFAWRSKGMQNRHPVRFPVGMSWKSRGSCMYALDDPVDVNNKLDYIQGRKQIYGKYYCESVKKHPHFERLKNLGQNIMIIEVDGPVQESLEYYKAKYNVDDNFIVNGAVECTIENMRILLNDSKHVFGHGYFLGMELLGITDAVCQD